MNRPTSVPLVLLICISHLVAGGSIPDKEDLCGLIVDTTFADECLQCFTDAGHISENPEDVRACVATYMPPLLAKCAVPHARAQVDRIQQVLPGTHHNHTNANLLPNCLRRRTRELLRYLEQENRFTKQAGKIVKTVAMSRLIPAGGPNMLSATAQNYILNLPVVKVLVQQSASSCLETYDTSRSLPRPNFDEDMDVFERHLDLTSDSNEDSNENLDSNEDAKWDDDDELENDLRSLQSDFDWEDEDDDDEPDFRTRSPSTGNNLPYGGTNPLSLDMLLGQCIIDALVENDAVLPLIQVIASEDFYYPIPNWWVEPLLRYYKEFREELENDPSG